MAPLPSAVNAASRRVSRAWWGLVLGVAALVFVLFGPRPHGMPPPSVEADPPSAVAFASESMPAVDLERSVVAADGSQLFGCLTDAQAAPVEGWEVTLSEPRPETEPRLVAGSRRPEIEPLLVPGAPRRTARAVTDAQGAFTFETVAPGDYLLQVSTSADPPRAVTLAAGERRRLDLQLADDRCAVALRLTHAGAPLHGRSVQLRFADGGERVLAAPPRQASADTPYRFEAPTGHHRLQVAASDRSARTRPMRPIGHLVAELSFVVPPAKGSLQLTLEVSIPALELVASDGGSAPVPDLTFSLEGTTTWLGDKAVWEVAAADGRSARIGELPPGEWTVTAQSPYFDAPPQTVRVAPGGDVHRLVLTGRRCAVVRLDLRELDGQPYRLPLSAQMFADSMPSLIAGGREVPCTDVASALVPRLDGMVLGFANVTPGPAAWPLADREVDGQRRLLMFEPVSTPTFDVSPTGDNTLTLCVQPRAFVELVACGRTGMESPRAEVHVYLGAVEIAALGVVRRSRWQGCLPPGEYRVVIHEQPDAEPATTREHRVFVERQNMSLRLRP